MSANGRLWASAGRARKSSLMGSWTRTSARPAWVGDHDVGHVVIACLALWCSFSAYPRPGSCFRRCTGAFGLLTNAEWQARYRERRKAGESRIRYGRPADRRIAGHASPKTTTLYDRTADAVSLDEIERIVI